jgi:four helix bundle protein
MHETRSFRTLKVWQDAMSLVEEIYRASQSFPVVERYALAAQLRRAAISIPSNIGEGYRRRRQPRVYLHHLSVALGSQAEVEVQLEIAVRLGYLTAGNYARLHASVEEIGRMLHGLTARVERELRRTTP